MAKRFSLLVALLVASSAMADPFHYPLLLELLDQQQKDLIDDESQARENAAAERPRCWRVFVINELNGLEEVGIECFPIDSEEE